MTLDEQKTQENASTSKESSKDQTKAKGSYKFPLDPVRVETRDINPPYVQSDDVSQPINKIEQSVATDNETIKTKNEKVEFVIGEAKHLRVKKDIAKDEILEKLDSNNSHREEDPSSIEEKGYYRNIICQNLYQRIEENKSDDVVEIQSKPDAILVTNSGLKLSKVPTNFVQLDSFVFNYHGKGSWAWQETNRWYHYEENFDTNLGHFSPPFTSPLLISSMMSCEQLFHKGSIMLNPDLSVVSTELSCSVNAQALQNGSMMKPEELIALFNNVIKQNEMSENDAVLLKLVFFAPPRLHGLHLTHQHHVANCKGLDNNNIKMNEKPAFNKLRNIFKSREEKLTQISIDRENKLSEPLFDASRNDPDCLKKNLRPSKTEQTDFAALGNDAFRSSRKDILRYWTRDTTAHDIQHLSLLESRIENNAESVAIHVGTIKGLEKICFGFIRLQKALFCQNMTELDEVCPVRFIIFLFGPPSKTVDLKDVCRVIGSLFVDKQFRSSIYQAQTREDILKAIRNYSDFTILLPLQAHLNEATIQAMSTQWRKLLLNKLNSNENHPSRPELSRFNSLSIEQNHTDKACHQEKRSLFNEEVVTGYNEKLDKEVEYNNNKRLSRYRCKFIPFESLLYEIRGLYSRWMSDFYDVFTTYRSHYMLLLSSIIFIFFVVLAPCLTFGSLLNAQVDQRHTIYTALLCSGLCQFIYALLSGQPLIIVGITGPTFIIEICIFLIAKNPQLTLPVLRFQVAVVSSIISFLLSFVSVTKLACMVRRSLEEIFNFFICVYFIFKAMKTIFEPIIVKEDAASLSSNLKALFLCILMLTICLHFSFIQKSNLFRRSMRNILGFFNVPISLAICTLIDQFVFKNVNALNHTVVTNQTSEVVIDKNSIVEMHFLKNFITVYQEISASEHAASIGIGFCLSLTILTETILSGLTVAKAERKLKKPSLFAIDFFVSACILPVISGVMFWPFLNCAAVRSNSHTISLTIWDTKTMPGVPHKVVGCVEQRITSLTIGILLALTVLIDHRVFNLIPKGALLGMFMYMGIMGLRPLIITKRIAAFGKRRKYWNEKAYASKFPSNILYSFVSVQVFFIIVLIIFNLVTEFAKVAITSLLFPFVLLVYGALREFFLPNIRVMSYYLNQMDKFHEIPKVKKISPKVPPPSFNSTSGLDYRKTSNMTSSPNASWNEEEHRIRRLINSHSNVVDLEDERFSEKIDDDDIDDVGMESRLNNPFNVYSN